MEVIVGKRKQPRRVLLYGTHGVGKSTWAASSPKPLFLQTEDGLDDIGVDRSPLITDYGQFEAWLSDLLMQPHEYRTLVIDTADWLEKLIWKHVATVNKKISIEEIPYYKGYQFAAEQWHRVLAGLDAIRAKRTMSVIVLAHAKVAKFNDPQTDPYDRYEPDLHKLAASQLQEWSDEVFFATYRVGTVKRDEGFSRDRVRAIGSGDRVIYTSERPTHLAKRRAELPDVMPLDFSEYVKHLAGVNGQGNIDGVVVDGSSKKGKVKSDG